MSKVKKLSDVDVLDLPTKNKSKKGLRKRVEKRIGRYHHSLELVRTLVPLATLVCQVYMISYLLK